MRSNLALAAAAPDDSLPTQRPNASLARRANELARDLMKPQPRIYWTDLIVTAALVHASLGFAIAGEGLGLWLAAALVCVFALYRAVSFIHELAHLRPGDLPGFKFVWNALIGVPFLAPSLMYEGVHILHHAKDRYGTDRDPEYLPLTRYPVRRIVGVALIALLAPVGLVIRFAILTPLSFVAPPVRRAVVAKMSAMSINPAFAREDFDRAGGAAWRAQEIACWLWSWTVLGSVAAGRVPLSALVIALAIMSAMAFVNQLRTLAAHAWDNAGEVMTFEGQFLDSVNVPPPALAPLLWAPVGLRYHALHHLLPRMPYHNLHIAHRRLTQALPAGSAYSAVAQTSLTGALRRLLVRAARHRNRSA